MFTKLWGKTCARGKNERVEWEANAVWFRVRYTNPSQLRQCIFWLAKAKKVGRVALWYQLDGGLAMLHIGLSPNAETVFVRMAQDYNFFIQERLSEMSLPPVKKLNPLVNKDLPWDISFMAQIVGESVFFASLSEEGGGDYFPIAPSKKSKGIVNTWELPTPNCGLSQQPVWPLVNGAASELTAVNPDNDKWLLGLSSEGIPLQAGGSLNLYGGREESASWLIEMCTQLIRQQPGNLIIIDGFGNLVPQLKRKNSILRLINSQLNYMDMDNEVVSNGFNPLTAVPGETEADMLLRWKAWFRQMGVHSSNLPMLTNAYNEGVRELMELVRWLELPAQQIKEEQTASLRQRLSSFLQTRTIQEWVDWPDNPFRLLPEGGLLFSCSSQDWQRTQMLFSVLLGAINSPGARLILHGIPWKELKVKLPENKKIVLSNGPILKDSKSILVGSHKAHVSNLLGKRYFSENPQLRENLHLLRQYEGVVITPDQPICISWKRDKQLSTNK